MGAALKLVAAVDFGVAKRAEDEAAEALADAPAWVAAAADVAAVIGLGASDGDAGGTGDETAVAVPGAVVSPPAFADAAAAVGRASLSAFSEDDDKACALAADAIA